MENLENLRAKQGFICDMDGVIYHGNVLLDGAFDFIHWLEENKKNYIFLTNSSERSPRELQEKLARMGLSVGEEHFYTSAMATAEFLSKQHPGGSAYVIGEAGLVGAIYNAGFSMNDVNPDYVVIGETSSYSYEKLVRAIRLVNAGANLIATNPDLTGPTERGIVPATRALVAPIELATGKQAYFVGKPNPLMMQRAQKRLGTHTADTAIVGDRMDTDIIAGIESEIDTVLVLTGVTAKEDIPHYPYRPTYVLNGIGDIPPKDSRRI